MCCSMVIMVKVGNDLAARLRFEKLYLGGPMPLNAVIHNRWLVARHNSRTEPLQVFVEGTKEKPQCLKHP